MHPLDELGEDEIAELKQRLRELAVLLTGDPEATAECSYCHGSVELGEALLTMNLTGVLAHIRCPEDELERVLADARPDPAFDMESFDEALAERLSRAFEQERSGEILIPERGESEHGRRGRD